MAAGPPAVSRRHADDPHQTVTLAVATATAGGARRACLPASLGRPRRGRRRQPPPARRAAHCRGRTGRPAHPPTHPDRRQPGWRQAAQRPQQPTRLQGPRRRWPCGQPRRHQKRVPAVSSTGHVAAALPALPEQLGHQPTGKHPSAIVSPSPAGVKGAVPAPLRPAHRGGRGGERWAPSHRSMVPRPPPPTRPWHWAGRRQRPCGRYRPHWSSARARRAAVALTWTPPQARLLPWPPPPHGRSPRRRPPPPHSQHPPAPPPPHSRHPPAPPPPHSQHPTTAPPPPPLPPTPAAPRRRPHRRRRGAPRGGRRATPAPLRPPPLRRREAARRTVAVAAGQPQSRPLAARGGAAARPARPRRGRRPPRQTPQTGAARRRRQRLEQLEGGAWWWWHGQRQRVGGIHRWGAGGARGGSEAPGTGSVVANKSGIPHLSRGTRAWTTTLTSPEYFRQPISQYLVATSLCVIW